MAQRKGNNYYGVARGRVPGIYTTWSGCNDQVDKFPSECYAGFEGLAACVDFMTSRGESNEESLYVYGPRGGRYSIQDWKRKQGKISYDKEDMSNPQLNDCPLVVNLPDIEGETGYHDVRPKITTSDIILQPLLAYTHCALQAGTFKKY